MKSDEQLIEELERAVAGLWFVSEIDHPLEVFRWEGSVALTPEYLREAAGLPPVTRVEARSLDQFFRNAVSEPSWKSAEELKVAHRYQEVVRLLKENLEEPRAYRVGEMDIPVFVVGRSAEGNWLGLKTRVVET